MDAVTYSLKLTERTSENYYSEIHSFTNEVLLQSVHTTLPLALEYMDYLQTYNLEVIRETEEYLLELLSFGILWRTYSPTALSVKLAPFISLARMAEWRKKHQKVKPIIDFSRGILTTLFLLPKNVHQPPQPPTLEKIDHLCKWLEATGEFREQALRFIRWRAFWGTKNDEASKKLFSTIADFCRWFEVRSEQMLGSYTQNVEKFLSDAEIKYRWREDRISCSRKRIEYHLNMVGAELMNRAFRHDFQKTEIKAVLLPGCMRALKDDECKAVKVKEGLICSECLPQCRVNQLKKMGTRQNFEVYIIPHASDLSLWAPQQGKPPRGVIAAACVTTLVEGGWELKRYDVPAQCVLLDFSGCKKHWHCKGVPTSLNIKELKRIIS